MHSTEDLTAYQTNEMNDREATDNMLEMKRVGAYIATLRRARGMTQSTLAAHLQVSHQAISNWERGEAMPDAAQWVPLSRTLGTTVDRLLCAGEVLDIQDAQVPCPPVRDGKDDDDEDDDDEDDDEDDEDDEDDDEDDEDEDEDDEEDEDVHAKKSAAFLSGTWHQLIQLAPFLGEKALGQMLHRAVTEAEPNWNAVQALAPFLSSAQVDDLARQTAAQDDAHWSHLVMLAPFLSDTVLDELAMQAVTGEHANFGHAIALAPFLREEALDTLADQAFADQSVNGKQLRQITPFLSEKKLRKLAAHIAAEETPNWALLNELAPFLPSETLDTLIADVLDPARDDKLAAKPTADASQPRESNDADESSAPHSEETMEPSMAEMADRIERHVTESVESLMATLRAHFGK